MYGRILVPLDGSNLAEQVLPYVKALAQGLRSKIELLNIILPLRPDFKDRSYVRYLGKVSGLARTAAQEYLDKVAAPLRDAGLTVSTTIHEGDAATYIVDEAQEQPDTLIAMSTHGRSGVTRWVMGSVTDKVLHATTNPMLVVRAQESKRPAADVVLRGIIVPLDGSGLAEQVLPHAAGLAKALGLSITLVNVIAIPQLSYAYANFPTLPYEDLTRIAEEDAKEYLEKVVNRLRQQGVSSVEYRVTPGGPASIITDAAKAMPDHLIAMTTHGRSGIRRWVLGSVADRVVSHSTTPVLMIRAAGEGSRQG